MILSVMLTATAEEKSTKDTSKNGNTTVQQNQAGGNKPAKQQATPATPDTFKPSEEISEDLSVSFPVDI